MKDFSEHKAAEAIRRSIANRLAQRVNITNEMIEARKQYEEACRRYRQAVNEAADQLSQLR